jgi:hypothetical protein
MFIESIGVFAVAAVGGPTTRLDIADTIRIGAEDAEERFRMHRAGTNFDIVGLLEDASFPHPEMRELQD